MTKRIGLKGKLFIGEAGAVATTEVKKIIKDVNLILSKDKEDVSSRDNDGWKEEIGTLKGASLEIVYLQDDEDIENLNKFRESYLNGTPISLFCTTDGKEGLDGDWEVEEFPINQPLTGAQGGTMKLMPRKIRGWKTNAG